VGFIILLLAGTQVLDWRWLVLLPLAALVLGTLRVRRRLPSLYVVAQMVDHRLGFQDALSTALYFSRKEPLAGVPGDVRELQLQDAERRALSADARKAIPYIMPRTVYTVMALALVATSLFALRYGLNKRLDLKPPLATILHQSLGFFDRPQLAKAGRKLPPPGASPLADENGDVLRDRDDGNSPGEEDAADRAETASNQNGEAQKASSDVNKAGDQGPKADSEEGEPGDERAGDEGESSGDQQGNGQPDQNQDPFGRQNASTPSENNSLMSKLNDALQNLMSRMKPQPSGSQQQSMADQRSNQRQGQQGGKQKASKDGQRQNSQQQAEGQEGEAGEQGQMAQDSQGKGTGKSDSLQATK